MTRPTKDRTKTKLTREQMLALFEDDEALRVLVQTTVLGDVTFPRRPMLLPDFERPAIRGLDICRGIVGGFVGSENLAYGIGRIPIGDAQGAVETAQHTRAGSHGQQHVELLVGERCAQTRAELLSKLRIGP